MYARKQNPRAKPPPDIQPVPQYAAKHPCPTPQYAAPRRSSTSSLSTDTLFDPASNPSPTDDTDPNSPPVPHVSLGEYTPPSGGEIAIPIPCAAAISPAPPAAPSQLPQLGPRPTAPNPTVVVACLAAAAGPDTTTGGGSSGGGGGRALVGGGPGLVVGVTRSGISRGVSWGLGGRVGCCCCCWDWDWHRDSDDVPGRVSFRSDEDDCAVAEMEVADFVEGAMLPPLRLPRERLWEERAACCCWWCWWFVLGVGSRRGTSLLVVGEQMGEDGKTPPPG